MAWQHNLWIVKGKISKNELLVMNNLWCKVFNATAKELVKKMEASSFKVCTCVIKWVLQHHGLEGSRTLNTSPCSKKQTKQKQTSR